MVVAQADTLHVQPGHNYEYWPSSGWIPQAILKSTLHLGSSSSMGAPELMTAEQVKAMSVSDHQMLWRKLVFSLATLIPETQGRLESAAGYRLKVSTYSHTPCVRAFIMHRLAEPSLPGLHLFHDLRRCMQCVHSCSSCRNHAGCENVATLSCTLRVVM